MIQEKDKYRLLIENLPDGLAYCKMVLDSSGKPVDYIFLEVNSSFEALTGLQRDHIIGKKVTELYPGIKGLGFDWIGVFDQVTAIGTGKSIRFQKYLDQQERWYEITAYSDQPSYFAVIFHDITERKQAEEKSFETKEYLEKLIKYANAPIIVWDTSLSITRFNKAFENLSVYDASEVIGKKIDILFSKNKIESALEHIQKTSSGERWEAVEIEIQRKDGEPRIVLWNSANILDKERNNVIATIAQGQDITERKQAEEALRKSEEKFSKSFHLTPLSTAISLASDRRYIEINDAFVSFTGYSREEVIGRNSLELGLWMDAETRTHIRDEIATTGKVHNVPVRLRTKSGEIRDAIYSAAEVFLGGVPHVIAQALDITERKQAEEALRTSEARYRLLVENANEAILVVQDGMLKFVNRMTAELSGYSEQELTSRPFLEFIPPDDRGMVVERHLKRLKGNASQSRYAFRLVTRDGSIKWVEIGAVLIDWEGRPATLNFLTDITERKRAEDALRESNEIFKQFMENSPNYVFFKNDKIQAIRLSSNYEKMLGKPMHELLGKTMDDLFPSDLAKSMIADDLRVLNEGKQITVEEELNGRFYTTIKFPILVKGKPRYLAGYTMDITERKQAELLILIQRDLALAISFSHEIDKALPQCLDTMLQLSEMDCGGIYLMDQASGDLNLICHKNLSPAFIKSVSHYKADSAHVRLVLQGKPLFTRYSELDLPLNEVRKAEKLLAFVVLPLSFENRVIGCLNLGSKKIEDVSEINREVLKTAATLIGEGITRLKTEEELKLSYQKLQKAIKSTIQAIALILEKRDPYTAGHQKRMTKLACVIAEEISLSPDKIEGLYIAGIIHDIGKINVPTEILSKPGRLSEIEFSLIKTHPQVGSDILKEMELPGEVSSIVLQHHERMDGSGYPSGLSGEAILLEARILAVADVVEAMASHRPYRPALGLDKALEEITKNKGKLYDPEVVDVCLKLFKKKGFKFE
jgi:PAS domain S-box-containing protein